MRCIYCSISSLLNDKDLPVGEYLKANETFSSFLRTNCSLPSSIVDQLLRAQLSLQVVRLYLSIYKSKKVYTPINKQKVSSTCSLGVAGRSWDASVRYRL